MPLWRRQCFTNPSKTFQTNKLALWVGWIKSYDVCCIATKCAFYCNTSTQWGEFSSKLHWSTSIIQHVVCIQIIRLIAAAGFSISPNMLSHFVLQPPATRPPEASGVSWNNCVEMSVSVSSTCYFHLFEFKMSYSKPTVLQFLRWDASLNQVFLRHSSCYFSVYTSAEV